MSLLRLAPFALGLVACANNQPTGEPISSAESAAATAAVESTVMAVAPVTSTDAASIAASYMAAYPQALAADGSCVTIETNNLTFVKVTFACTGPFATTGTLEITITSPTTVEATADLTTVNTTINGSLLLTIPASQSAARTLDGDLVIAGPKRELDANATASWVVSGNCVTYSASGNVTVGSASKSYQISNKTACRE
jgi:hypothetical protein